MKAIIFAIVSVGLCLAAEAPKPAPPQQDGMTELEASKVETLQARRDLLTTQANLLGTQIIEYEKAVKAAHPTLKIHLDPQTLRWVVDPEPKPEEAKPAAPAKR
jgi:hypothetical protein